MEGNSERGLLLLKHRPGNTEMTSYIINDKQKKTKTDVPFHEQH